MCFRPSAIVATPGNQVQEGACPSCGMPVAASIGIDSGTCPHCGNPILSNKGIKEPDGPGVQRIL